VESDSQLECYVETLSHGDTGGERLISIACPRILVPACKRVRGVAAHECQTGSYRSRRSSAGSRGRTEPAKCSSTMPRPTSAVLLLGIAIAVASTFRPSRAFILDNGKGLAQNGVPSRGLRLISMEERVRELQGRVADRSEPGHGTVVRVELPLSDGVLTNGAKSQNA
jgi:hypothetical protein